MNKYDDKIHNTPGYEYLIQEQDDNTIVKRCHYNVGKYSFCIRFVNI